MPLTNYLTLALYGFDHAQARNVARMQLNGIWVNCATMPRNAPRFIRLLCYQGKRNMKIFPNYLKLLLVSTEI